MDWNQAIERFREAESNMLFSKRQRLYRLIQENVSQYLELDYVVAWPDVLGMLFHCSPDVLLNAVDDVGPFKKLSDIDFEPPTGK